MSFIECIKRSCKQRIYEHAIEIRLQRAGHRIAIKRVRQSLERDRSSI